jgi:hypothetical protein
MIENEDIIIKISKDQNLSYVINIEERSYPVLNISIMKSTIPVREPTMRGGVYFTDIETYKIKVTTDFSIKNEIPKLMLGPNADFKPILIETSMKVNGKNIQVTLKTHLTNTIHKKETIDLNLIIDKLDLK